MTDQWMMMRTMMRKISRMATRMISGMIHHGIPPRMPPSKLSSGDNDKDYQRNDPPWHSTQNASLKTVIR